MDSSRDKRGKGLEHRETPDPVYFISQVEDSNILSWRQCGLAGSVDFCYPSAFGICLNVLFFLWLQRKEKKA